MRESYREVSRITSRPNNLLKFITIEINVRAKFFDLFYLRVFLYDLSGRIFKVLSSHTCGSAPFFRNFSLINFFFQASR